MLTRNCESQKARLIYPMDFNVRVTVFDKEPKYYVPKAYYSAWIKTIHDSLGRSIVNSESNFVFTIKRLGHENSSLFHSPGNKLIEKITKKYQKPISLRIETIEENPRAWVFYLLKDIYS